MHSVAISSHIQLIPNLLISCLKPAEIGLSTIRLETQNTNVTACRFYEKYGFKPGGYDQYLYDAIKSQDKKEIALFTI
ncbi:hypothetical protein U0035_03450 [Niabella yanshanensis]|uniref:GNAT family N-acetyltransferase n=1 Tax=Niabella yanshanensis TaxID=577386 RepID=A0ABZ0W8C7_9BACT|nr:hypothetical protein [Niabella yanshanensis]WQD39204.1 hypothetical protein U0035_03450 [Niabella yanshanensis]